MTELKKSIAHAELIAAVVSRDIVDKYMKGQQEHGGYLPDVPGLVRHAWEEAMDLPVYLFTLRQQLQRIHHSLLEDTIKESNPKFSELLGKYADTLGEVLK